MHATSRTLREIGYSPARLSTSDAQRSWSQLNVLLRDQHGIDLGQTEIASLESLFSPFAADPVGLSPIAPFSRGWVALVVGYRSLAWRVTPSSLPLSALPRLSPPLLLVNLRAPKWLVLLPTDAGLEPILVSIPKCAHENLPITG